MASLWDGYVWPTAIIVAQIVAIVVPLLAGVAYLTLAERKVIEARRSFSERFLELGRRHRDLGGRAPGFL